PRGVRLSAAGLEDGGCGGGQGRAPPGAAGCLHGAEVTGVDADGGQRRSVESVLCGARRSKVDAERPRGLGGRVVKQAEQQVVGAKAAVASSARLVGGCGEHQLPCILAEPLDHHSPRLAYFACPAWRETPSASPICSHDQPCSRASRTWIASTRSASRCSAPTARRPTAGSADWMLAASSSDVMPSV